MGFYKHRRRDGRYSGYDHADTIADADAAYRRCRTVKHYILENDSPDLATTPCAGCGRMLADDPATSSGYRGNRCDWVPGLGTIAFHYTCAWGATLTAVAAAGRSLR